MSNDSSTKCTVNFDTGFLSTDEVEGIFEALPIDVSFVSAENEVHYFNREKERVFKRSRSVIGKKVQNCHPEKSLSAVNRILEDFRAGKREKAEFWINLHGQMVHIRYFPVRDRAGKYLGCLEVSQDITEIQKITGEKRLLDESKAAEYAETYSGIEDADNG
ncbi:MAG: PAS domain-containing protein [Candidatus Thermoplasmatota archaeon]|nr:PAS domain-containing protein [Candidatus Thermoplasmatota archaeon]